MSYKYFSALLKNSLLLNQIRICLYFSQKQFFSKPFITKQQYLRLESTA